MEGLKPETIDRFNRAKKFVDDGFSIKDACIRARLSQAWYFKIRKAFSLKQAG